MGKGGEIFVLDMGEPVRIGDLAENLIRLSGFEPGKEIPIEVTGLRPGERLREKLITETEELIASEPEKIFKVRNHSFNHEAFRCDLEKLRPLVATRAREGAVAHLKNMAVRY